MFGPYVASLGEIHQTFFLDSRSVADTWPFIHGGVGLLFFCVWGPCPVRFPDPVDHAHVIADVAVKPEKILFVLKDIQVLPVGLAFTSAGQGTA